MKLIFVRHGQTDWNKDKRLMGRTDIELNEEGLSQCQELLNRIEPDFEVIFSSPLKRAYKTAQIIGEHFNKAIIVKEELAERDFGSLSGKTWEEVNKETNQDMRTLTKAQKYDFRPYGGESAEQVKERILKFLSELKRQPYSTVVVVCHSGVISMLHFLFPDRELPAIAHTSIYKFTLNPEMVS